MCFVINPLTLNLLTTTIVAPPNNASKWEMGFNSAFKGLSCDRYRSLFWILYLLGNTFFNYLLEGMISQGFPRYKNGILIHSKIFMFTKIMHDM
jgi:hypothetical protein